MRIQHDEAFAFLLVRDRGHNTGGIAKNLIDRFFDAQMRDHLTSNLAEARHAVGNADESVVIKGDNVTGDVPPVPETSAVLSGCPK
jgi:hypothetical protein